METLCVLCEVVTHLVKELPTFHRTQSSLLCLKQPDIISNTKADNRISYFIKTNIVLPFYGRPGIYGNRPLYY